MLEWYRPGSYLEIMDDVDALFKYLSTRFSPLNASLEFSWDEGTSRTSIEECFRKYANLNLKRGLSDIDYWSSASQASLQENIASDDSFEDIFFRVWLKLIEPNLGVSQPEIVFDYPASMAALAKLKAPEDVWSERFEVYIKGVEIGNAFSELTDSAEQDRRFREANEQREGLGHPPHPIDQTFIDSVGEMPRTGGIAIGVERLLMVLTGETDISQFFLYPLSESSAAVKRT